MSSSVSTRLVPFELIGSFGFIIFGPLTSHDVNDVTCDVNDLDNLNPIELSNIHGLQDK